MQTYEQLRGHPPDFVVKYRLYTLAEGGRKVTFQHLRCDFMYEGDDPVRDGIFMIHPEFLDERGCPLREHVPVHLEGEASMWILAPEMRSSVHRQRAKAGVRGYFMEGARRFGDAQIERIVGLHENPAA